MLSTNRARPEENKYYAFSRLRDKLLHEKKPSGAERVDV
jgi:hypothetical protein